MRPRFLVLIVLALASCSNGSDVVAGSSSSPTPSPEPSATEMATSPAPGATTGSDEPSPAASSATPPSTAGTTPATPPAPGLYTYRQSGEFRPPIFEVPNQGTLRVYASTAASGARRQRHVREYSDDQSQEQVLLFTTQAILLERITQRYGSGSFAQTFACPIDPPLIGVKLPMRVGTRWQGEASCSGLTMTTTAEVRRRETRTVGGINVETFVLRTIADARGDGVEQHSVTTMWISPLYRLAVRITSSSSGSQGGFSFSSTMTENLVSLTPRR